MWRSLEDAAQTAVDTEPAIKMAAKRRSSSRQWVVAPAVLARPAKTRRDDRIVEGDLQPCSARGAVPAYGQGGRNYRLGGMPSQASTPRHWDIQPRRRRLCRLAFFLGAGGVIPFRGPGFAASPHRYAKGGRPLFRGRPPAAFLPPPRNHAVQKARRGTGGKE